jgi:hypothetical protein
VRICRENGNFGLNRTDIGAIDMKTSEWSVAGEMKSPLKHSLQICIAEIRKRNALLPTAIPGYPDAPQLQLMRTLLVLFLTLDCACVRPAELAAWSVAVRVICRSLYGK